MIRELDMLLSEMAEALEDRYKDSSEMSMEHCEVEEHIKAMTDGTFNKDLEEVAEVNDESFLSETCEDNLEELDRSEKSIEGKEVADVSGKGLEKHENVPEESKEKLEESSKEVKEALNALERKPKEESRCEIPVVNEQLPWLASEEMRQSISTMLQLV